MFVLRKIDSDHVEYNYCLGDSYIIISSEKSPSRFNEKLQSYSGPVVHSDIYAFICYDDGMMWPLCKQYSIHVLNHHGDIFQDISFK